jgi:hypothetical protein
MRASAVSSAIIAVMGAGEARAQSTLPRVQVGVLFSQLRMADFDPVAEINRRQHLQNAQPVSHWFDGGAGARVAFPVRRRLAFETELLLFPRHFDRALKDEGGTALDTSGYRFSDKLFLFSGVRVGAGGRRIDLFGRLMPGLVQIGRMPLVGFQSQGTVRQGQEYRAALFPGLNVGGGTAITLSGRVKIRIDAADMWVWYRPQRIPGGVMPLNFSRQNFQLTTGLSVDIASRADEQPRAGSSSASSSPAPPTWEWGGYLGLASGSVRSTVADASTQQYQLFVGIEPRRMFRAWSRWSLSYAPEVLPFLLLSNAPVFANDAAIVQESKGPDGRAVVIIPPAVSRSPVIGAGGSPFGVEAQTRWASKWNLYADAAIGGIWFTRRVPDLAGREFNYTFQFGGGVQRDFGDGTYVRLGYRFHHLSNDYTAPLNPGVIGHVLIFAFGVH